MLSIGVSDVLDRRFDVLERQSERLELRFDAKLHVEMNRMIKWTVGSLLGGIMAICAAATALGALFA